MKKLTAVISILVLAASIFVGCKPQTKKVEIKSAEDLNGLKLGCQAGTTGEIYIQENLQPADLRSFRTGIDAALDLKNGGIDAIVLDELPAKSIVANNADLTIIDLGLATEEYAIAVKKGNGELLSSINNTIAKIRADGTYENMVAAFMPTDGNIVLPESVVSEGEVIRMGTNAAFPPFEYVEGNRPVGFDVTMSELIAKDYGRKLEIVDMAFDGLIAALQSGAIDFVAAGMTATEERRANVDFSEAYYSSKQVVIVRK